MGIIARQAASRLSRAAVHSFHIVGPPMPLALGLALSLAHARSLNEGGGVPAGFALVTALNAQGVREPVTALNAQGVREPVWARIAA